MKKISQYNWNWWFMLTVLLLVTVMQCALIYNELPENEKPGVKMYINIAGIIGLVSLLPCLYIGLKPTED
jgi:NhaP-type Na+/H+ or K+/H+ antiporter